MPPQTTGAGVASATVAVPRKTPPPSSSAAAAPPSRFRNVLMSVPPSSGPVPWAKNGVGTERGPRLRPQSNVYSNEFGVRHPPVKKIRRPSSAGKEKVHHLLPASVLR